MPTQYPNPPLDNLPLREGTRSGRPQNGVQLFFVTIAMVAIQLVVLILIADSSGLSGGAIAVRVIAMLGFTTWFVVLWIDRRGSNWVLLLPAIVPLFGFGYLIYAGLQPPPPQEALRAAITDHCGLGQYDRVPPAGFIQFEGEIVIVVGTNRSSYIHRDGAEYERLRNAVLGGKSLGAERIVCIEKGCVTTCDPPRWCAPNSVELFEIGSPTATDTAEILDCRYSAFRTIDNVEQRVYEFGSSSSPEMERVARSIYKVETVLLAPPEEAMKDADPEDL